MVVTVIILLILAGVTLFYVLGDNGIIKVAQDAKKQTEDAMKNEQQLLGELANQLKEEYGGDNGDNNQGGNPDNPDKPVVDVPIENIKTNWEEIEKIAGEIAKDDSITSDSEEATVIVDGNRYTIRPGDIFEVEYNGESKRVRVLGFKHDDLVDQTVYGGIHEKASISFEFLDFMTGETYMAMNTTNTNENGWGATQMRKDLNGYTTSDASQSETIGGLGANLNNKSYIKQVKKAYIGTYNDANSVTTCNDYLWMLSCSEVWSKGSSAWRGATYGLAIAKEGDQYKWYKNNENGIDPSRDNSNFIKQLSSDSAPSRNYWWLRSPIFNTKYSFNIITSSGNVGQHDAIYTYGVAPGFCI